MYLEIIKKLLPKKNLRLSQLNQIQKDAILLSSIYDIVPGKEYDESNFNQKLDDFCALISRTFIIDRSELRRILVDEIYMDRTKDCKTYWLNNLTDIKNEIKSNLMNYNLKNEISSTYEALNREKELKKEAWLKSQVAD